MSRWVSALRLTGIGFYIGICIAGGAFAGWWFGDEKPLFVIVGLVIGLIVAFFGVYQMIRPFMGIGQGKDNS